MSNAREKYDHIFWEDQGVYKKINTTLTKIQACNILNLLSLNHELSEKELEDIETLKQWIKDR